MINMQRSTKFDGKGGERVEMLAKNIKRLREAQGLTQKELGLTAGLSQPYISELETGTKENPPIETLQKLAAALRTSVAKLMGEVASA